MGVIRSGGKEEEKEEMRGREEMGGVGWERRRADSVLVLSCRISLFWIRGSLKSSDPLIEFSQAFGFLLLLISSEVRSGKSEGSPCRLSLTSRFLFRFRRRPPPLSLPSDPSTSLQLQYEPQLRRSLQAPGSYFRRLPFKVSTERRAGGPRLSSI